MKNGNAITVNTTTVKRVPFGGWGFVTGIQASSDATLANRWVVVTMDVNVPHIKKGTADFVPLLTSASMPVGAYQSPPDNSALLDNGPGYAVAMAPSNKNVIAATYNALLFRSTDGGASFTQLGMTAKRLYANSGDQRLWNNKLAFHPTDPNTLLLGTTNDGVHYTTNANLGGSSTFTAITGLTAPANTGDGQPAPYLVAFDPNGTHVYIHSYGTGTYRSTTGVTGSFSLIGGTGAPTSVRQMEVLSDGTLVCADFGNVKLKKLARGTGNTWTTINLQLADLCSFAYDPADLNKLTVVGMSGPLDRSLDGGATWVGQWFNTYPGPIGIYQNDTRIPALGGVIGGVTTSKIVHDGTGKVLQAFGKGVTESTPPTTLVRWDWYGITAGLEELGCTFYKSVPGNPRHFFGTYDKGLMVQRDLDRFSATPKYCDPAFDRFSVDHLYDMDYATGDPNYLVFAEGYNAPAIGYSADGGATLQKFAAQHPQGIINGGAICSTGNGKAILLPGNNLKAVYTLDGGATWPWLNLPGQGTNGTGNWINSPFNRRDCIAADHERAGYAMVLTSSEHPAGIKAYRTTDHGVTWTERKSGVIDSTGDPQQYYDCTLDYIPGRPGELLYTSGGGFAGSRLMHSTDDGANWTPLQNGVLSRVGSFAFGPTLAGQTYPLLFLIGTVGGVFGVYYSLDFLATAPVLVTRYPLNTLNYLFRVGADRNNWGKGFIMVGGGGAFQFDILDVATGS